MTALASVADAANAHFIRYYDTVMPMLKNILYSASSKAEQLLRAKALECVSLVGMAVGKERFRADAQEVMAFMQQLQVSFPCTVSSTCPCEQTLLFHLVSAYDFPKLHMPIIDTEASPVLCSNGSSQHFAKCGNDTHSTL